MGRTVEQDTRSARGAWLAAALSAVLVVAMCAFIFYMSDRPADESDEMSLGIVARVIEFAVPGYDRMSADEQLYWKHALNYPIRKMAHFTEYAVLGALMMNLLAQLRRARSRRPATVTPLLAVGAWALSTAYAGTDEVHQLFVAGRACKFTDVLIDSSGVLLGVLIVAIIIRLLASRTTTESITP